MDSQDSAICKKRRRTSLCSGCHDQILDQYILRVAPDLEWHAGCLRCVACDVPLDETCTCFVRDLKTYCKRDYVRLFGVKCAQCQREFNENDLVMRARTRIYHIDCFRCFACSRQLVPGDEYSLKEEGLLCRADHDVIGGGASVSADDCSVNNDNDSGISDTRNNNNNDSKKNNNMNESIDDNNDDDKLIGDDISPVSTGSGLGHVTEGGGGRGRNRPSGGSSRSHKTGDQKTTRVRTVLNEKQLHTLRTCYGANPRPDALMKEQLVEMTGLSPRVIRVWFQNKRCKDKKRSVFIKHLQQQQQQQQEKADLCDMGDGWLCQKGVPLIASSPVPHDSHPGMQHLDHVIEVHQYDNGIGPWNALVDFSALQRGGDEGQLLGSLPPLNPLGPHHRLVTSFGESSTSCDGDDVDDDTVVCLEESRRGRRRPAQTSLYIHHQQQQQQRMHQILQQQQQQQLQQLQPRHPLYAADS